MNKSSNSKRLVLGLLFTTLILLATEGYLRLFNHDLHSLRIDRQLFQANAYGDSYGLKANASGTVFGKSVHVSSMSGRITAKSYSKKKRISLQIGDSVVFGAGVEDEQHFCYLLSQSIDSFDLLNLSVPGYGMRDYRNLLSHIIEDKSRDWEIRDVVIYYSLPDVWQYSNSGQSTGNSVSRWLPAVWRFMKTESRLLMWLKSRIHNSSLSCYQYDVSFYKEENPQWQKATSDLHEIATLCEQKSIPLKLVLLPSHQDQLLKHQEEKAYPLIKSQWSFVPIWDARDYMDSLSPEEAYLANDPYHFSSAGHSEFARQWIRHQGYLTR